MGWSMSEIQFSKPRKTRNHSLIPDLRTNFLPQMGCLRPTKHLRKQCCRISEEQVDSGNCRIGGNRVMFLLIINDLSSILGYQQRWFFRVFRYFFSIDSGIFLHSVGQCDHSIYHLSDERIQLWVSGLGSCPNDSKGNIYCLLSHLDKQKSCRKWYL